MGALEGAVGEQVASVFPDPVLHVASGAADLLVEAAGGTFRHP